VGWVRDSDDFYDHPKLADLDLAAWGLRAWGTAWANRNLSDGVVPYSIVKRMDPDGMASGALIDAGVWHLEDGCIRIHDYLDYQPSAEQVRSKREKERERWQRRASSEPPPPQLRAEYAATPTASQPQPQLSSNEESARARRGKTACPDGFQITDEMRDWVLERYPTLDYDRHTEGFVAWAKANDRRYSDWVQAWRNWMHRKADDATKGAFR
jgi:hypothetical protein